MFGDYNTLERIAEEMLKDIELTEILEMNNLTELEALTILLEGGHIGQPERYFARLEVEDEDEEGAEIR